MKKSRLIIALLLSASATAALADDYYCTGFVGEGYYDNIIVPYGETCTLDGTYVDGNVYIERDGALATMYATIYGNVEGYKANWVTLTDDTYVYGNVQLDKTRNTPMYGYANKVCDSYIYGDIQLYHSYAPFEIGCDRGNYVDGNVQIEDSYIEDDFGTEYAFSITSNYIDGDLQFNYNMSDWGGFWIYQNMIEGNLECYGNYPDPEVSENTVYGNFQCYGHEMPYDDDDSDDDDDDDEDDDDYARIVKMTSIKR